MSDTVPSASTPSLWQRLPDFARAIIVGGLVAAAGIVPWFVLVTVNLQSDATVPWSVPAMAFYLVIYWLYLSGFGPPKSTKDLRRALLRVEKLSKPVWTLALLAGTAGLASMLVLLLGVYARIVTFPPDSFPDTTGINPAVVVAYIFMLALVAGVAEEAGYRGFMQSLLEKHYGPVAAISTTAIIFGLAHFNLMLMPVYIFVAVLLGTITTITNSIVPGIILHAAYDFFLVVMNWQFGMPVVNRIDWTAGPDAVFWIAGGIGGVLALTTVWALFSLRNAMRAVGA